MRKLLHPWRRFRIKMRQEVKLNSEYGSYAAPQAKKFENLAILPHSTVSVFCANTSHLFRQVLTPSLNSYRDKRLGCAVWGLGCCGHGHAPYLLAGYTSYKPVSGTAVHSSTFVNFGKLKIIELHCTATFIVRQEQSAHTINSRN